ncbi:MAG: amidohydrolase family protein [Cyclobacteriaceae bacterium]|nr:amidohydrolase family protein [Cyclobacteriaceae bacterium]
MKRLLFLFSFIPMVLNLTQCNTPAKEEHTATYDIVIHGGRVMDPASGTDRKLNLGITGGKIAAISEDSLQGNKSINAAGLVVAPGFIDLHVHEHTDETYGLMARGGVTSAFELEVGTADVPGWYAERNSGQRINYGVSIGHIQVRMKVMGDSGTFVPSGPGGSQPATPEDIAEMERRIEEGLAQGALAVGFGLAYTPATNTEEYEDMLRIAARHGASSHIHLRGELAGVKEAISGAINTRAPLHIVHINSSGGAETAEFLSEIQAARDQGYDITTEAYPYEAGMTMIEAAMFDDWESWTDEKIGTHQWAATGEWLSRETFGKYRKQRGAIIIHSRTEEMTNTAIESPLTMIASDGFIINGYGHPRTAGSFAKVLGKYVREKKSFTLMDALRKMTIDPAGRLEAYVPAMARKGRITAGADADITVFDPEKVIDHATYEEPMLPSGGIPYVIVNGTLVVENGELVAEARPGIAVRNKVVE